MSIETLIIGSGVAATTIADKILKKNPKASILILEAGDKVKMQDQSLWQDYVVNNQSYSKLPYYKYNDLPYPERDQAGENLNIGNQVVPLAGSRVMTYGGSTIHWGGWSFRLKPEDFKMKTNTGKGIDWPFGYEHLEPYYCQAEDYIGVAGASNNESPPRSQPYPFDAYPYTLEDQPMFEALGALNWERANVPIARHGIANTTSVHAPCKTTGSCKYCPFGARYASPNFLNDMCRWQDYPNFEIRINSVVEQINMDSKHKSSGVTYLDNITGKSVTVSAQRVIVAGGAIESPKLLMRSCSEYWPQGIGNDNDLVGRYYVTHPYFVYTGEVSENPKALQPEMDFPTLCSREFDSESEQAKGKYIFVNPPTAFQPKSKVSGGSTSVVQMMQQGVGPSDIKKAVSGPAQIQLHGMVEIFSEYSNRIMNLDKKNRIGLLETIVDYSKSPEFSKRMEEITEKVEKLFSVFGGSLKGQPNISWRADHSACTCRMASNDQEGVVDENLKIFGVDNLYVCSNAVFPNTGAINPTLTLTALSIRLGEHLNQQGQGVS